MAIDIVVPTLGESVTEATVAKWFKTAGETFVADEPLLELETDKVSVEVSAPASGVLREIRASEGADVAIGAILGIMDQIESKNTNGSATQPIPASDPNLITEAGAPEAEGSAHDIIVPTLGESVSEATVGKWFKEEGESVTLDEPLVELETDKVSVEVNAPITGVLTSISAATGVDVQVGAVLGTLESVSKNSTSTKSVPPTPPASSTETSDAQISPVAAKLPLSPAVRKLVEENELNPEKIKGTGRDNRLTKGDVLAAIEAGTAKTGSSSPAPGAATPNLFHQTTEMPPRPENPREERVRMTKLRKVIASRLKEAQNTAAMLTTWNEVDMGAAMELRSEYKDRFEKKHGVRLGFMSFFVRAACIALKEWPAVNAEIYGDEIIYKNYYNVGVAVGTPQGLVVPVIKDADEMRFAEIESSISDFGRRARDGKLGMDEMTGGTFTISNGGVFGSLNSMPILNVPQSAILGMHTIQKRPIAIRDQVVIRPMMYLALSYDHRIVDGREAVSFLVRMKECIEDPQRIMLDV